MVHEHVIDSLDRPELAPYRTMRLSFEHYRDRLFVAEGDKLVRRLLESGLTIVSALMPPDHFARMRPGLEARPEKIDVFVGDKSVLESLTGFTMYQGVLACGRIPPPLELDVAWVKARRPRFFVALDGLANAENLGGVIRTAAGFGADAILVGETCAHPYLRRSVRASMGAVFDLPMIEPVSLAEALGELRRRGMRCVAAHPHSEERLLPEAAFDDDCCVVLGSEGQGLTAAVLAACDDRVSIPMAHGVDSLNVAAAAAVFLYEVWRQRIANRGSGRSGGSGGAPLG